MEVSILTSIKKLLGVDETSTQFDEDIMIAINSAFMRLNQLGVGPEIPFSITDSSAVWDSFFEGRNDLSAVKSYIYLKTRLIFDPPANSFLVDAIKNQISELEWQLNIQAEGGSSYAS